MQEISGFYFQSKGMEFMAMPLMMLYSHFQGPKKLPSRG